MNKEHFLQFQQNIKTKTTLYFNLLFLYIWWPAHTSFDYFLVDFQLHAALTSIISINSIITRVNITHILWTDFF